MGTSAEVGYTEENPGDLRDIQLQQRAELPRRVTLTSDLKEARRQLFCISLGRNDERLHFDRQNEAINPLGGQRTSKVPTLEEDAQLSLIRVGLGAAPSREACATAGGRRHHCESPESCECDCESSPAP